MYNHFHEIDSNPETNQHLAEIIESIKANGWMGLPLLADGYNLFNGCHRATACEILEVEPLVHQIELTTGDDEEYAEYLIGNLANAGDTDQIMRALEELYEEGMVDELSLVIMRAEYNNE